jgi:hypothetical protein
MKDRVLLVPVLIVASLVCGPGFAARKTKADPRNPYVTADMATPTVNVADLAYRAILFEDCTVPEKWEAKARPLVDTTRDTAISRLQGTQAFTTVRRKQDQDRPPDEPYLVVKSALVDYRIVGRGKRILVGVAAGNSYITYKIQVYDGNSNQLQFEWQLQSENNAFVGTFSGNDSNLPVYLGNALADYLALRARKDKGVDVVPLDDPAGKAKSGK